MRTTSDSHNTIVFSNQSHHSSNPELLAPAIDRIVETPAYFYVRSELSNAYKRVWKIDVNKLFYRNVLFLRPGQFIVYDTTRSNSAIVSDPLLKDWYTQYKSDPNVDIPSKTISAVNGSSKVYTKSLFPTDGTFTKCTSTVLGDPGYCGGAIPIKAGFYRVKYNPLNLNEYDQFLHVIEATGSTASQTQATLIEGIGGRGTLIKNPSENIVAMFTSDQNGADITNLTYSVDTSAPSKHIITSLTPNQNYNVSIDGQPSVSHLASSAGIIEFSNPNFSPHTYSITMQSTDVTAPSAPTGLGVE
jgi:hypothetical protein